MLGLKTNINPFENQSKHDFIGRKNMREILLVPFFQSL